MQQRSVSVPDDRGLWPRPRGADPAALPIWLQLQEFRNRVRGARHECQELYKQSQFASPAASFF